MIDNAEVIGKLEPVKPMTAADRQMLDKYSSVIGRHMCRYLRHDPELIDLKMDKRAWVNASELIQKFNAQYRGKKFYLNLPVLIEIVKTDNKQRYPAYFFRILLTSYRYPRPNMFRWLSS